MEVVAFPEKIQKEVVPYVRHTLITTKPTLTNIAQVPFWVLITFGAYLLFKLGWGVFTFNDVPDAYAEIQQQILEARVDLKARGVDVGED
jgi:dolichyl-phosphate mannosyltransferase polypeptide 3